MSAAWPQWLADFHFLRPAWLLLLAPLAWLCWRLRRRAGSLEVFTRFCDASLLPYLTETLGGVARGRLLPFALAGVLGVLALAGPTAERVPQPVYREQAALVVLLDLSRSMSAQDVVPSRLERARYKIRDLLAARLRGQTALLVYSDRAYVVTPLTDDVNTIVAQLEVMDPALMPSQGTDAAVAVEEGLKLIEQAGYPRGDLLLVTDEVPAAQRSRIARLLEGRDVRLSILGIGTPAGAPVPDADGGFVKDAGGQIVVAHFDAEALAGVARSGHGHYETLAPDARDVEALTRFLDRRETGEVESAARRQTEQWQELGPWLLLPLVFLASLAFRRGLLLAALPAVLLAPRPAAAFDWWFTPDQAGQRAFEREDYAAAAQRYADPAWRAAARYRAGDYAAAARELDGRKDAESLYNRGNALARQGRYDEALAAYDAALQAQPSHDDAKYNKALIEDLRRRQQSPPEQRPQERQQSEGEKQQGGGDQGSGQSQDESAREGQGSGDEEESMPRPQRDETANREPEQDAEHSAQSRAAQDARRGAAAGDAASEDADARRAEAAEADADAAGRREDAMAAEQWLRQVPDDPGGLWRRKFRYQYQRLYGGQSGSAEPW
ncbi:MAG TPA: VWA domain-containing protein [Gammaproteobacteria bacterium]|nr:VWA domain-containing protein [Gammaproteobacteria bacterium]